MNTLFALMAEYGTATIPVEQVAEKFFNHNPRKAKTECYGQRYPFPVFRLGGAKSPWLVLAQDLATYIDKEREAAVREFKATKSQPSAQ